MKINIMLPPYAKDFVPAGAHKAVDLSFVNIAYRPKPKGTAMGGPNGVLAVQQQYLGELYRGFYLRYHFEPLNGKMPEIWSQWIKEQGIATMSKNLLSAHHYVQNSLANSLPRNFSTRPGAIYHFVCHDIGSAAAAHMCGFPFTLIYHQQGSFVHERTSFGETLNEAERHIMNTFERIAFEEADRVYFPSNGAKKAFIETTTAVDHLKVRFGDRPLYNTLGDIDVDDAALRRFLIGHGLAALLVPRVRKKYLVFVSIGDFSSNKGIDRCPDVLAKIAKATGKKVVWISMGSKHRAGIYERLEEEKSTYPFKAILVPTRQDHALTMAIVKFADWLLMLQRHSIFDFSTLETMKLGTGVILSPIGGNLEFSKESNILYVDPEDTTDQSIADIVNASPEDYGLLNQQVFDTYFSPATFVDAYRSVYDDVIERTLSPVDVPAFPLEARQRAQEVFSGKTVIICGPGSSVSNLSKEEMEGKVLIALNSALLHDLPFDVHVMQDEPKESSYWGEYLIKDVTRYYGIINRLASKEDLSINFEMLREYDIDFEAYQLSSTILDDRFEEINFDLEENPVWDMRGVLFSAIQIAVWGGAASIELAGIDFSAENFGSKNTNIYNRATFQNLSAIVRHLHKRGFDIRVLHTTSENVREIVESGGTRGVPVVAVSNASSVKAAKFEARLNEYDPIKRTVVRLGDKYLPDRIARPLDKALKKLKIL